MIDTPVVAALDMYVEPDCVRQAGATFIGEVCRRLGVRRYAPGRRRSGGAVATA